MARKKETTAEAVKTKSTKAKEASEAEKSTASAQTPITAESNSVQENAKANWTATVDLPPQYSALNIREEPNGKIIGTLKNGAQVTMYKLLEPIDGETWVRIGEKQFVNMKFLKTE